MSTAAAVSSSPRAKSRTLEKSVQPKRPESRSSSPSQEPHRTVEQPLFDLGAVSPELQLKKTFVKNLKLEDGALYTGEMLEREPHGDGTATWPDGDKYVGQWKDGKMEGHGIKRFKNGPIVQEGARLQVGVWHKGILQNNVQLPNNFTEQNEMLNAEILKVNLLCLEAKEKAKEAYLKVQNKRYNPDYFPLIQGENPQGQMRREPLPNVITGIIGEYAAEDFVGDGKDWNIEKSTFAKIGSAFMSLFKKRASP